MAYLLIVDDDEDFASAVEMMLSGLGHEVKVELEIESGLKSMEERLPDVAILDVMFPENSSAGFELARTMRESEKLGKIPILLLTAVNTKFPLGFGSSDIDEDWLPVKDFLEKPVDLDVLNNRITELLKRS